MHLYQRPSNNRLEFFLSFLSWVSNSPVFFGLVWYPQASIPSIADTHTGGDAVLGKPEGSPARRHSRNSSHMFVYIVACACSRHELDFKILLFRSFVSRKGYCVTISRRSESILSDCVSHLSSRRSDGGLTMQVSCLNDKPNISRILSFFLSFLGFEQPNHWTKRMANNRSAT